METIFSKEAAKQSLTFDERMIAIENSIDAHHVYLENYLTSLTRNHADAEDLASKLWVHVLNRFEDHQIGNLPLLRRKAYQFFIDHYRAGMRSSKHVQLHDTPPELAVVHVGEEAYSTAEEALLKEKFWSEFPVDLPTQQKEVLWLSARYGFTIQEIAQQLSLAPSTVGDWLQQARQRFTDYFNTL